MKVRITFTYKNQKHSAIALQFDNFCRLINGIYAGMLIDNENVLTVE